MSRTDHTGRMLATLAHLAATRTGSDGQILRHALHAALVASALNLAPADADDRAAEPAHTDAERMVNNRARALIEQAQAAARRDEFASATTGQADEDESADQHRARTGHWRNFGCCVTAEQRAAAQQRWDAERGQAAARQDELVPATVWTPPVAVVQERQFAVGDTVRLRITQSGTWIDEDLADEEGEENARVRVTVRAGRVGRVTVVRTWPTPFPYVVLVGDQEIGVPEEALERVATVWTPSVGDVVTHTGIGGTWVVERVRDEDAVWARRSGRCEEPELLAVAELRPAELVQGGAR
ncbi:hypothetical protein [Nonomuraea angiospora]